MISSASLQLKAFEGTWVYSHALSDSAAVDEVLAQQGMPWLMRKAASMATPTMEVKVLTKPLKETDWDGKPDPEEKREGGEEIEWEEPVTVFELINRSGIPALPTRTQLNTVHARPVSSEIKIPGFPPARLVMVSTPHGENGIRVVTEHVTDNWRNEAVWSLEGNDKLTRTMWFKKGKFERRYKVVNERKV